MTRTFKTPADAVPYVGMAGGFRWADENGKYVRFFTAAETAQLMKMCRDLEERMAEWLKDDEAGK
jgi:hypothetical protein